MAIRTVAFLTSFLSMVFIATNTGDRFDTVLVNGRVMGEAGDTATAFAIGMLWIIAVLLGALHRQHDLVGRTYDITALSFAISASVALFPTPYWA